MEGDRVSDGEIQDPKIYVHISLPFAELYTVLIYTRYSPCILFLIFSARRPRVVFRTLCVVIYVSNFPPQGITRKPFLKHFTKVILSGIGVLSVHVLVCMDQPGKVANPARGRLNREN